MNMNRTISAVFAVLATSMSLGAVAVAEPRRVPPPEAYGACSGKKTADACSVQLGAQTVDGTCVTDEQQNLFCRPAHPAMGPGGAQRHAPPPEAFSACQGKSVNAQCTVQLPDRAVSGTCAADTQSNLFCRPDRPPPPPPGEGGDQ
jgi:hypothetical protein